MTQLKTKQRRGQIRDSIRIAALEEFASNGLNGTSTQMIASRAGISKAQLHYYIEGKSELYEDILVSIIDKWDQNFFVSASDEDPKVAIASYIELKIKDALKNPLECRLFSQEVSSGAPVLRKYWQRGKTAFVKACGIIEEWINTGEIDPVDPMLFQMEIWGVSQHYADYEAQVRFYMGLEQDEPLDEARIIKHAQNLFLRSLGLDT